MFMDHLTGKSPKPEGAKLPWSKAENLVRFGKGEVTLWIGINGHGKSLTVS